MGKSDAPATPDYTGAALATANANKYTEQGPAGTVGWSVRPGADPRNPQPGDYIRSTELSPDQQQLYDQGVGNQLQAAQLGQQQLTDLGKGTQGMQDALYRRATQYYDQNFGDQREALRTRLLNQGLAEGSGAYTREMRNFEQAKNSAYADATDRAITEADQSQNSAVSRLAQILAISRGQSPTSGNVSAGPDLTNAMQAGYNANLGSVNASNAATGQGISTVGTLGALAMFAGF